MTTKPGNHTFVVYQGATFSELLTWKDENGDPVNLAGYTARMKGKRTGDGGTAINLTTENGGIALGGAAGTITLTIGATDTAALAPGDMNYDLEVVSGGGAVTRLLRGIITVDAEVTA